MPTPVWSLRITPPAGPSTTKSLADWGVVDGSVRLEFATQSVDTLTFDALQACDDDELCPFGASVDLLRDGVRVFAGRAVRAPRRADGDSERVSYEFEGPWWWLDSTVFEQDWRIPSGFSGGSLALNSLPVSRVILGRDLDGAAMSAAATVASVFTFLADRLGAPVALGDCELDQVIPAEEVRDLTCAEVLRRMLRWFPGVQAVWDVSGPVATLHLRRRSSLPALSLDPAKDGLRSVSLTPRHDLRPSAVLVRYMRTNSINSQEGGSQSVTELLDDLWPVGSDPYAPQTLRLSVALAGGSVTEVSQRITTELIQATSLTWWKKKLPWLSAAIRSGAELLLDTATVTPENPDEPGAAAYDKELVDGAIADWMIGTRECPVVVKVRAKVPATDSSEEGNPYTRIEEKELTVRLRSTNAASGNHSHVTDVEAPEDAPSGLARRYYEECEQLQYDGALALDGPEWDGVCRLGHAVNLAGFPKRPEWASMRALVQRQSVDLATGVVSLSLGPAKHLNPDDWVPLSRPGRGRDNAVAMVFSQRATGKAGSGAAASLPAKPPRHAASAETSRTRLLRVGPLKVGDKDNGDMVEIYGPSDSTKISLPRSAITRDMAIRELKVCVDGSEMTILVIASEPF